MTIPISTSQLTAFSSLENTYSHLSELTQAAIGLYNKGLNVFPVPRPKEIELKAKINLEKIEPTEKIPYILNPLFFKRMHLCNEVCSRQEQISGRRCPGSKPGLNFTELFLNANLAVMTGRLSGNLAVIDCDDITSFSIIKLEFNKRNLPFWGYFTSRGCNLIIRILEGEINNLPKSRYPHVEIWGRQHYCILPPSVHSSGCIYTWLDDHSPMNLSQYDISLEGISISKLDWLDITLHSKKYINCDLYDLPEFTYHLSDANRKILTSPINKGERNTLFTKVIYDIAACIQNGLIQIDEAQNLLIKKADTCTPPFSHKTINSMLRSALNKKDLTRAIEFYGGNCSIKHNSIVDKAQSFSITFDWRKEHGRYHLTDRAVFQALCIRAKLDNCSNFRASYREIMELANIQSHQTIRKSLTRLLKNDLISRSGFDSSRAYKYSFGSMVTATHCSTISTCNTSATVSSGVQTSKTHLMDIFSRLGRVSEIVYFHLIEFPEPSAAAIARNCKLSPSSTRKALNKMLKLGLVALSRSEMMYFAKELSEGELVNLCNSLYVYGKSDKRREKNKREQEINVNRLLAKARNSFIRSSSEKKIKVHIN